MKTTYLNGKVYLGNNKFTQAFIVDNDKFIAVGNNDNIKKLKSDKVIDLKNHLVIPGINDSHVHFSMFANTLMQLDLNNITSLANLIKSCQDWIRNHQLSKDKPLWAEGWDEAQFTDFQRFPTRQDLDKASQDVPIFLTRIDRHSIVCNTAALKLMGIFTKNFKNENGGILELGSDKFPNGILKEGATIYARKFICEPSLEEKTKILINGMKYANSLGITSIHACDLIDENSLKQFEFFDYLDKKNLLTLKIYHQIWMSNPEKAQAFFDYLPQLKKIKKSEFNQIGSLKIFADGSIGSGTAALIRPYSDEKKNLGFLVYDKSVINNVVLNANLNNLQIVCHAIGDKAIKQAINAFKLSNIKQKTKNKNRNGIIHCLLTNKQILNSLKKEKILIYAQPCLYDNNILFLKKRLGKERADNCLAINSFLKSKIKLAFGTDAPVCSFTPWGNIYFAIKRIDQNNLPRKGFNTKECIKLSQAVDAYTQGSAYASFEEKIKGKIAKGYKADFVILNQDIFKLKVIDSIKSTFALKTYVNGKEVYSHDKQ